MGSDRYVLGGMSPDPATLLPAVADDFIQADGRPTPPYRDELRRIPGLRNAFSVVALYVQTALIIIGFYALRAIRQCCRIRSASLYSRM